MACVGYLWEGQVVGYLQRVLSLEECAEEVSVDRGCGTCLELRGWFSSVGGVRLLTLFGVVSRGLHRRLRSG